MRKEVRRARWVSVSGGRTKFFGYFFYSCILFVVGWKKRRQVRSVGEEEGSRESEEGWGECGSNMI